MAATARKEKWLHSSSTLDAVRTLHRTVVSLRSALERSRSELTLLKSKVPSEDVYLRYSDTIEKLSLENHVLRRKFLSSREGKIYTERFIKNVISPLNRKHLSMADKNKNSSDRMEEKTEKQSYDSRNISVQSENTTKSEEDSCTPDEEMTKSGLSRIKGDSEESEEIDDIELIFTTDDTKGIGINEELEPISDDGDVYDSKSEIKQQGIRTQSVLVETDISKCGIIDETDSTLLRPVSSVLKKNTSHRPVLIKDRSIDSCSRPSILRSSYANKVRPVLREQVTNVCDSETQTDITALPPCWKSESYLINNKTPENFTTLPSKFNIPLKDNLLKKCTLKLCDKTEEARRILLSDINFTSMVPELSRSVDHLCQKNVNVPIGASNLGALHGLKSPQNLTSGSSLSKFDIHTEHSSWEYDNSISSDQNPSMQDLQSFRRMRPSVHSLDTYYYANRTSSVPPSPTQRRHSSTCSPSESHYAYTSPLQEDIRFPQKGRSSIPKSPGFISARKQKHKVTFKESTLKKGNIRQSLPSILIEAESGDDSTESLIAESEDSIRKSIDSTLAERGLANPSRHHKFVRAVSESDLLKEFSPPLSAKPFVAKSSSDLQVDYFVKVINQNGRVVAGVIQYVGILPGKSEYYVGVSLPTPIGDNDGSFQGHQFFVCSKNCGVFVPFRKVILAWKI